MSGGNFAISVMFRLIFFLHRAGTVSCSFKSGRRPLGDPILEAGNGDTIRSIARTCHEKRWETTNFGCGHFDKTKPEAFVNGKNTAHVRTGNGLSQARDLFHLSLHPLRTSTATMADVEQLKKIGPCNKRKRTCHGSQCSTSPRTLPRPLFFVGQKAMCPGKSENIAPSLQKTGRSLQSATVVGPSCLTEPIASTTTSKSFRAEGTQSRSVLPSCVRTTENVKM